MEKCEKLSSYELRDQFNLTPNALYELAKSAITDIAAESNWHVTEIKESSSSPKIDGSFKIYTFDIFGSNISGLENDQLESNRAMEPKLSKSASEAEI